MECAKKKEKHAHAEADEVCVKSGVGLDDELRSGLAGHGRPTIDITMCDRCNFASCCCREGDICLREYGVGARKVQDSCESAQDVGKDSPHVHDDLGIDLKGADVNASEIADAVVVELVPVVARRMQYQRRDGGGSVSAQVEVLMRYRGISGCSILCQEEPDLCGLRYLSHPQLKEKMASSRQVEKMASSRQVFPDPVRAEQPAICGYKSVLVRRYTRKKFVRVSPCYVVLSRCE